MPRAAERARSAPACSLGALPADLGPRRPAARRLPSLEPPSRAGRDAPARASRARPAIGLAALAAGARWPCSRCSASALDQIGDSAAARHARRGCCVGARADVRLDGRARRRVARDPDARRCPRRALRLRRRAAGHVHRRAHVRDAARPPRRALARADRRAPHRAPARATCRSCSGTIVSQTLLNVVALVDPRDRDVLDGRPLQPATSAALVAFAIAPLVDPRRRARRAGAAARRRAARARAASQAGVRQGARGARAGARRPARLPLRRGSAPTATVAQLAAWVIQWLSCYVLLVALGLDDRAGIGAAAAVLFAVNVTAVLPGDAVEPRRLPGRVRRRADRRLRRRHGRRARPTGSSCRPSRSRPRSSWAPPRWSRRA